VLALCLRVIYSVSNSPYYLFRRGARERGNGADCDADCESSGGDDVMS